jgi:hypothetical protein
MGEVIVFKAEKDGTHLRPPPEGSAKIVFFTGVWHEPDADLEAVTRRIGEIIRDLLIFVAAMFAPLAIYANMRQT